MEIHVVIIGDLRIAIFKGLLRVATCGIDQEKYWEDHPREAVPLMKPKFYGGTWKVLKGDVLPANQWKLEDPVKEQLCNSFYFTVFLYRINRFGSFRMHLKSNYSSNYVYSSKYVDHWLVEVEYCFLVVFRMHLENTYSGNDVYQWLVFNYF